LLPCLPQAEAAAASTAAQGDREGLQAALDASKAERARLQELLWREHERQERMTADADGAVRARLSLVSELQRAKEEVQKLQQQVGATAPGQRLLLPVNLLQQPDQQFCPCAAS